MIKLNKQDIELVETYRNRYYARIVLGGYVLTSDYDDIPEGAILNLQNKLNDLLDELKELDNVTSI